MKRMRRDASEGMSEREGGREGGRIHNNERRSRKGR